MRVMTGLEAAEANAEVAKNSVVSALEQRRLKFVNKKKVTGSRETETLAKLNSFTETLRKEKIHASNSSSTKGDGGSGGSGSGVVVDDNVGEEVEVYRGQVMENSDHSRDIGLGCWHAKPLKFGKHIDDKFRNKELLDLENRIDDNYVVIDPRLNK